MCSCRFGLVGVGSRPPWRGRDCHVAPLIRSAWGSALACSYSLCAYADTVLVPGAELGGATNERTHP